jgi:hypothetical protein
MLSNMVSSLFSDYAQPRISGSKPNLELGLILEVFPRNRDDHSGIVPCILTPQARRTILATPGFPRPVKILPVRHRIGTSEGRGLGVFATEDMGPGDCVLSERPLVLASTNQRKSWEGLERVDVMPQIEHLFEQAIKELIREEEKPICS